MASSSPTLDAAAYPHILDSIIAFAPFASLCKLRTTCRAVKDRIDQQLFGYVAVVNKQRNLTETLSARPPFSRLPLLTAKAGTTPLPLPLSFTRVVDYFGSIQPLPSFPHDTIVRRRTSMPPPNCHTLVDYVNLAENDWPHLHVPSFVKRWVLHVTFDRPVQGIRSSFELITPDDQHEFNMIVVFQYKGAVNVVPDSPVQGPPYGLGILNDLKTAAIIACGKGTATFVGVEALPPKALSMPNEATPQDIRKAAPAGILEELRLRMRKGAPLDGKMGKPAERHLLSRLQWPTFKEWVASLDDEDKVVSQMPSYHPKEDDYWPGGPRNRDYLDPAFTNGPYTDWAIDAEMLEDSFAEDFMYEMGLI